MTEAAGDEPRSLPRRLDEAFAARPGIVAFAFFLLFGSLIYMNRWNTEFFLDGIHLIQTYDAADLREAFAGNWEFNDWETPGYRPLSALFNHTRALLFGEAVLAHRALLVVLAAAGLALASRGLAPLGVSRWAALGGGALLLAAPNNFYHVAWLSDGIHLVPLALGGAALYLASRPATPARVVAVHAAGLAAVLAREEGAAIYGAAVLVGLACGGRSLVRRALIYALPSLLLMIAFAVARQVFVPEAEGLSNNQGANLGYLQTGSRSALHAVNFLALRSDAGRTVWCVALGALLVAGTILARRPARGAIGWLLVFTLLGLAPLTFVYRENLVLLPSLFAALATAVCVEAVARRAGRVAGGVAVAGALVLLAFAARENFAYQLILHPYSATALESQAWVLGDRDVRIPEVRRERLARRLREVGFPDVPYDEVRPHADALARRASALRHPDGDTPFLPRRRFWIYETAGLSADRRVIR